MTDLEKSYRVCERIARRSGSNFYRSFAFLRADRRRAMNALYAFARLADDATDTTHPGASSSPPPPAWNPSSWLEWIEQLHEPEAASMAPSHRIADLDAIRPALQDASRTFSIPKEMLRELVIGVDMDTQPREYQSWEDIQEYGFRVASAVGICCIAIWSHGTTLTPNHPYWQPAVDCGLAFQMTNIVRDIREDAQRGRVYLPTQDLKRFRVDRNEWIETLAQPVVATKALGGDWRGLLQVQCERAHALFDRGWAVSHLLDHDGLRMFSLMWHTYRGLLEQLEGSFDAVLQRRLALPLRSKLSVVGTHLFTPSFSRLLHQQALRHPSTPATPVDSEHIVAPKFSGRRPRVGIVGGGLAGIQAAMLLARHGCDVRLMEAKSRLGGRAGSFFDAPSATSVDYCQHVGMKCCTELQTWIERTGQKDAWNIENTLHFVSRSGKPIAIRAWPVPAPFHLSGLILAWPDLTLSDRIRIAMGLAALLRSQPSEAFDRQAALAWLQQHHQNDRTIRNFWGTILVSALGEQIDRVTMGPVRKVLIDGFAATRDAYHLMIPQLPLSHLIDRASREALQRLEVNVSCGTPVAGLERNAHGAWRVQASSVKGHANEATPPWDALVIAVPWHRLTSLTEPWASSDFATDEVVGRLRTLAESVSRLESSPITGVHTWWDRPWLDQPHAIVIDRLCQWVFPGPSAPEASPVGDPKEYYYQVVISGSRDLPRGDSKAVLDAVREELTQLFPKAAQAQWIRGRVVTDPQSVFSVDIDHATSRLSQDCLADQGIFLAGDWTHTGWPATMEGALRSGALAAEGVLSFLQRPARLMR